jgi:hypothetical protein
VALAAEAGPRCLQSRDGTSTHARPAEEKLTAGKGINLPDSRLRLPALTAKDVDDLAFIARHADIVGYSLAAVCKAPCCTLVETGGKEGAPIVTIPAQ